MQRLPFFYHEIFTKQLLKSDHKIVNFPIIYNSFVKLSLTYYICSIPMDPKYRSTSLSQSPREWRKYFELSEVRHKQNVTSPHCDAHVQFLQDILLQYMCSQTVPTEKRIEMKTKEIHSSLFYFHFNYTVDSHNATALASCGNGDFLNYW